jgi:hypothetical protein
MSRGQTRPNTEALRRVEGTCDASNDAKTAKRKNYTQREVDEPSIAALCHGA